VDTVRIDSPRDGDVLNRHDGRNDEQRLVVAVRGQASGESPVRVNGIAAERTGVSFICRVPIDRRRQTITAACGDASDSIEVRWDAASRKRFRFSVDDNILFLRDLGLAPQRYPSLFDHPFLGFWRRMHDVYGTKVHFNIYYQTDGFDLTQMPERWREEWQANASWIRLSFHALQDKPDRPYRNARYAQIAHDFDLVTGHIRRFAGNELLGRTTTVHWAECPLEGVAALRDRGIEQLIGLFWLTDGACTTGYYLTPQECEYVNGRCAWFDRRSGMMFISCAAVVNSLEVDEIEAHLEARAANPHTSDMMELLIHEQYFRPELYCYQPDIERKVETALRWVTRHGYEPVFWGDGFLGGGTQATVR
jgi:hypothetical protein